MTSQVVIGQKVLIKELVDSFYAAMEQKDTVFWKILCTLTVEFSLP
jgi:truncated hemoglobin YjbI